MKKAVPAVVIFLAGLGLGLFLPVAQRIIEFRRSIAIRDSIIAEVHEKLLGRPPSGVSEVHWNGAVHFVTTCSFNAFESTDRLSIMELKELRTDVTKLLTREPSADLLKRIWDRLGQTGPANNEMFSRYYPILEQHISWGGPIQETDPIPEVFGTDSTCFSCHDTSQLLKVGVTSLDGECESRMHRLQGINSRRTDLE